MGVLDKDVKPVLFTRQYARPKDTAKRHGKKIHTFWLWPHRKQPFPSPMIFLDHSLTNTTFHKKLINPVGFLSLF